MEDKILLAHGSGGKLSHDLVEKYFVPLLKNPLLDLPESGAGHRGGPAGSRPTKGDDLDSKNG